LPADDPVEFFLQIFDLSPIAMALLGKSLSLYVSRGPTYETSAPSHSKSSAEGRCPKRFGVHTELLTLGKNIRRFRGSLKISQEKLAEKCELHRTYLSGVERGNRNLSYHAPEWWEGRALAAHRLERQAEQASLRPQLSPFWPNPDTLDAFLACLQRRELAEGQHSAGICRGGGQWSELSGLVD